MLILLQSNPQELNVIKEVSMAEKVLPMNKTKAVSEKKSKSQAREYTEAILVALLAALVLRTFVVQAFRIPTGSMKDTLLIGDFCW